MVEGMTCPVRGVRGLPCPDASRPVPGARAAAPFPGWARLPGQMEETQWSRPTHVTYVNDAASVSGTRGDPVPSSAMTRPRPAHGAVDRSLPQGGMTA